jgi:DNA polymerase
MQAAELTALLDWYVSVGVDAALGDDPVDRFEETRAEAEARRAQAAAFVAPQPTAERGSAGRAGDLGRSARPAATGGEAPPFEPTGMRAPPSPPPVPARGMPPERPRFEAPPQPVARPTLGAAVPGDAGVVAAREAAASAQTLDELRATLDRFEGCNLRLTARRLVFSDGNPQARLMFVGEAPGREEDETGLPFVGRSGQLLDRMLAAIGLDRKAAYIANVVPWRPPGNRTPTPQETEICKPFIARQVELVDPDVLVFLGGASAAALTGAKEGILRLRGRWLDYATSKRPIRAIATLHPAYLLRQPLQKRVAWRDLQAIRAALAEAKNG